MIACRKLHWFYFLCINCHTCTDVYICLYIYIDTKKAYVGESAEVHLQIYINVCVCMLHVNILHCFVFDFINLLLKLAIKVDLLWQRKPQLLLKKVIMRFEALVLEESCSVQVANKKNN